MHGTLREVVPRSNRRSPKSRTKKIEPLPLVFGDLARLAYPIKTLESIGFATGRARSTVASWLSGEHEAPADVAWLVLGELMRRLATRS